MRIRAMDLGAMRLLYGYNDWVNDLLLDTAQQLEPGRFGERFGASFGSIRGTMTHLMDAERTWLRRWQGRPPEGQSDESGFPDIASLRAEWQARRRELHAFLAGLTEAQLSTTVRYTGNAGQPYAQPLWQLMLQVVNHGTHHRAEVADMLTRAGHPPPQTDFIQYVRLQPSQA